MTQVVCLLGSKNDLTHTSSGLDQLRELGITFEVRIASAHRSPDWVHQLIQDYDDKNTQIYICVAGLSAHLAGVVASLTTKPVIAVPIANPATAGLDALLSMVNMPPGVPVATVGFDRAGFKNACLLASEMLALSQPSLAAKLTKLRAQQVQQIMDHDAAHRIGFGG